MFKEIIAEAKTSTWKMVGLIGLGILTVISVIGFIDLFINVVLHGI